MVPTEGSELKHRRTKKVATDEISMMPIQTLGDNFTLESKPMVLRGSPVECNVDVQWESCEDIVPINSYITTHAVTMEIANPLDWSLDVHLIKIDYIHTDVAYSNIELNGVVLKAKQDTGAQINVLSKTVFQILQKNGKLPLYPKTCVKLVRHGKKTINYLGTTKIKCNHNGTECDAIFYVTYVPVTKIILGLLLCIDLGLIVIRCDDECRCKNVQVAETSSSTPIENIQGSGDQSLTLTLPPVPLDTKIDETNPKAHVMRLYPDLFNELRTIKNAVVHLDVKPDVVPIVCSPRRVPDALQNSLKEGLDRMESMKVIRKLDINEASDWVHALVLVVKPNGKLYVCLDPCTLNAVL